MVANPPYMGSKNMNAWLSDWVKGNYPDVKGDLFSCFMVRNLLMGAEHAQLGFMTPYVWMFISSYERLREIVARQSTITSLVQLEYSGFAGATVPICTFTLQKGFVKGYRGGYVRLSDFPGADQQAARTLEALADPSCGWFYRADAATFSDIPGSPIAYWASQAALKAFRSGISLAAIGNPRQGLATGENARFVRFWWEVSGERESFDCPSIESSVESGKRWFPYNKGGDYRKWYGNNDHVVNWEHDGAEIRSFKDGSGKLLSRPQNTQCYFNPSITWGLISSSVISFRAKPAGHIFDIAGMSLFCNANISKYILGYCNSSVCQYFLDLLAPTLNYQVGDIARLPLYTINYFNNINSLVEICENLSMIDYDSFETSWNYAKHPLI